MYFYIDTSKVAASATNLEVIDVSSLQTEVRVSHLYRSTQGLLPEDHGCLCIMMEEG